MQIKVVIIEDDLEIQKNLAELISSCPDFILIEAFADAESFIKKIDTIQPDVVIVDIHLPGISGIKCIQQIKPLKPQIQFLIWTIFEDDDNIFDSLCAGATGYITKSTTPVKIYEAIKDIFNGGSPMSANIARRVIIQFKNEKGPSIEFELLSSREKEILNFLSTGLRYKEIAEKLFVSTETVRTHIRNIYQKLQVNSRTEALNKVFPKN
jgi:DNA-binding NarL/FixJ family response regulator